MAVSAAIIYLVLLALLMLFEEALIFPAPRYPLGDWSPAALGQEEVFFEAEDGTRLHGWYVAPPSPRAYVLFCHGNGEHVGFLGDYLAYLRDELNIAVFAFDYRGYGRSEGKPNEEGILADGRAAQAWLADRAEIAPGEVVLWGRSIGGAVAIDLAAANGARGLIVERAFTSLPDVAALHFPWAPVRWLMRNRLDSLRRIQDYRGPLLQSHGTVDSIVPFGLGRRLFEAHPGPKEFLPLQGHDHNDPPAPEWHDRIDHFLDQLSDSAKLSDLLASGTGAKIDSRESSKRSQ
ncbi:MAG: alpha/beta hydrolase [Planctomycetes bacterium]|nr:alpha/beta hydrolase [Planctomycetota bacterium]